MVLKFEGFDLALPLSKLVRHTRSATFITLGLPRTPGSRSSEFAPFVKIATTGRLVLSYPVGQKDSSWTESQLDRCGMTNGQELSCVQIEGWI